MEWLLGGVICILLVIMIVGLLESLCAKRVEPVTPVTSIPERPKEQQDSGPIGEPVKSLIAAMGDVHQWKFEVDFQTAAYSSHNYYYLTHIDNGLKISFMDGETHYIDKVKKPLVTWYGMSWMTQAEKDATVEAFKKFKIDYEAVQQEYNVMALAQEREKFMVFVSKRPSVFVKEVV